MQSKKITKAYFLLISIFLVTSSCMQANMKSWFRKYLKYRSFTTLMFKEDYYNPLDGHTNFLAHRPSHKYTKFIAGKFNTIFPPQPQKKELKMIKPSLNISAQYFDKANETDYEIYKLTTSRKSLPLNILKGIFFNAPIIATFSKLSSMLFALEPISLSTTFATAITYKLTKSALHNIKVDILTDRKEKEFDQFYEELMKQPYAHDVLISVEESKNLKSKEKENAWKNWIELVDFCDEHANENCAKCP